MRGKLRNEERWSWDRRFADEVDDGSQDDDGETLVAWDPWWPVTARPKTLRVEGTELETRALRHEKEEDDEEEESARAPRSSGTFRRATGPRLSMRTIGPHDDAPMSQGPSIEGAMMMVEGVLSSASLLAANAKKDQVAAALQRLAGALRQPRDVLEELLYDVGSTLALNSLSRMERIFEDLARRADELAVEAGYRAFRETRLAVRQLLRETDAALAVEVDTVVDVYWLDAGVVD